MIDFAEVRSLVGNERGFIHKKLLGIGKGLVGAVPGIGTAITTATSIIGALTAKGQRKQVGLGAKFPELGIVGQPGGGLVVGGCPSGFVRTRSGCVPSGVGITTSMRPGPCPPPLVRGPSGLCIERTSPLGAARLVGEATMGRYGAALIPGSQIVDRATCLPGMQLGDDGLCYNKENITNKQRMWPAGRKPLLTGGEMNAIRIAASARSRVARTAERLGIVAKAPRKRRTPAGHRAKLVHASEH